MDLDRQVVASVQHFNEYGETWVISVSGAENLFAVEGPKFMERFPGKRPFIDDGLLALAVHDFPRLAEGANGI